MSDPSAPQLARIYGFIARDVRKAVLLRRGPSKQVRLLTWDMVTDRIEGGQWLKGRIYERRCDLSADGSLFAYFAAKHRGPVAAWTAVCRPPLLTALSFFPKGDCWGGGGLFKDAKSLMLNHVFPEQEASRKSAASKAIGKPKGSGRRVPRYLRMASLRPWEEPGLEGLPRTGQDAAAARNKLNLRITPLGDHSGRGEDNPIEDLRLRRDGWTISGIASAVTVNRCARPGECSYLLDPPAVRWKPAGDGSLRLGIVLHGIHESQGRWHVETMQITGLSGAIRDMGRVDWADVDHTGDILFAAAGCLYRLAVRVENGRIAGEPRLIADLNAMAFEPVPSSISRSLDAVGCRPA